MSPIAFIHRLPVAEQRQWLELLQQLLPNHTVLLPEMMSAEQVQATTVAIVANPNPADLVPFSNLLWVQSVWAGVEGLVSALQDRRAAQVAGQGAIKLVRLTDPQLAQTMAEAVLAWTLYLHRNMPEYAAQQARQQWLPLPCAVAAEVHVAVLGAGELGASAIHSLLKHGYKVSCWSRSAKHLEGVASYHGLTQLPKLLQSVDILVNLLPLTVETEGLLNASLLKQLPGGAKLINFSRGAVVNATDLIKLLDSGHIGHAVLDVFTSEPLVATSPLWTHPKISILPHISAPTNVDSAARIVAANIAAYQNTGVIPPTVNLERGY